MMMRMLKQDLSRSRVVSATLLLFVMLSALLASTAIALGVELSGAMDQLFRQAAAPHFVQMHAGEIHQESIDAFARSQPMVTAQQTVEMLNISGASLYLGDGRSEADSVMENAFVTQSPGFDFLLDLDNQVIQPRPGEVAVPIYLMRQRDLRLGDRVRVVQGEVDLSLEITAFVRDVQMNPSLVSSKRFVVHPDDWQTLRAVGESEYLIEFLLDNPAHAGEFERLYQQSGLPQKDTAVTWSLYRMLNALTDGLVIGVVLLIALLLMAVAFLCLRFTILATLEGDFREIGVMKAIGLPMGSIRRLYMAKYTALAAAACLLGYLLSLPLGRLLSANITLYMGRAAPTAAGFLAPLAGAAAVLLLVWSFCRWMMRRFRNVTAVEALRAGTVGSGKGPGMRHSLHKSRTGVNLYLGVRDVLGHPRQYGVLCLVFVLCAFLMLLPLNLYTTMASPRFISYMGAGRSDVRIDLARSEAVESEYARLLAALEEDASVERLVALVTASFPAQIADGGWEALKVETGDFAVFPLEYLEGAAPATEGEIALSVLQAQELEKTLGDTLTLLVEGEARQLTICGLYQDVTNGGKTAKALLPWQDDAVLWYVVNLDLAPDTVLDAWMADYQAGFPTARVMDMEEYLGQTLGGTVAQLRLAALLALVVALCVAVCITALFLRMLLAKDARDIAVMRSLGFSSRDIAIQYSARSLLVLAAGVLLGTLAVATLGQGMAGLLGSMLGASSIRFVVRPLLAWLLYPLALLAAVAAATLLCSKHTGAPTDLRSAME